MRTVMIPDTVQEGFVSATLEEKAVLLRMHARVRWVQYPENSGMAHMPFLHAFFKRVAS